MSIDPGCAKLLSARWRFFYDVQGLYIYKITGKRSCYFGNYIHFGYHKRSILWFDYYCDDSNCGLLLKIPGCRLPPSFQVLAAALVVSSRSVMKLVSEPLSRRARAQKICPSLLSTASQLVPSRATVLP